MKKTIVLLTLLITVLTVSYTKAQFKIVGYAPNWINLTAFSSSFDYSRVTTLNIAFKDPDAAGYLPALSSGETALVNAAHNNGVQVLISLCGGSSSENATIQNRYFTLINSTNRSAFASKLKQYVINNNLDGVDLDLEGPAINGSYGDFVQVLADSLHPVGKLLTAALSEGYGGYNVPSSTFAYFDWINIMAYDACGPTFGTPGQHSKYSYAEDALDYWKGRGLAQSKAILGVPFYGYEFGSASRRMYAISYKYVAANYPDAINDDEVSSGGGNTIYYNGISTIVDKTDLAKTSGGGIMIWDLSLDAPGNSSLLKYIRQVAGSAVTDVTTKAEDKTLLVYPNPTNGSITLQGELSQNLRMELYNTLGEKVRTYTDAATIDISTEAKGIYYLHIIKEGNTSVKKIVLQ